MATTTRVSSGRLGRSSEFNISISGWGQGPADGRDVVRIGLCRQVTHPADSAGMPAGVTMALSPLLASNPRSAGDDGLAHGLHVRVESTCACGGPKVCH